MWVSRLEINNIKSFEASGSIHLDRKMNILLGANNSGKSTIIRVLYLLQNPAILTASDVRIDAPNASATITLENIDNTHVIGWVNSGLIPTAQITGNRGAGSLQVAMVNNNNTQRTNINIPAREPDNFIYPYLSKRKVQGYRREVHRVYVHEVADTLVDLVPKVDRLANKYYTRHEEFEQACVDILGFPITTFQAEDNNGKQVGIIVNDYDNIPIEAMGEGVPNLLGLIVNLCMAKGKLFLIEELENDIHPRALKSLLELIISKAEDNQFVISTHSNIVARFLGSIPGSKIHYISLAPYTSHNRIPTALYREVGNSSQERRDVLEDLGYDVVDYDLAKGWLFLEESSAERIIREYLIPWFAPGLQGNIRTIAAQGNTDVEPRFNDFNRLFLFLHLEGIYKNRAWVIVDGDPGGQKIIDDLKQKYTPSGWEEEQFQIFSKEDFEEYYPADFQDEARLILQKPDGQHKQAEKKKLLYKMLDYIKDDEQKAREAFEQSAREVIDLLQSMEKLLQNSRTIL